MSANKIINPGFGVGGCYGTPTTATVAANTITIGVGQWVVAGLTAAVNIQYWSTANGVTGTYTILGAGGGGFVVSDGANCAVASAATHTYFIIPLN